MRANNPSLRAKVRGILTNMGLATDLHQVKKKLSPAEASKVTSNYLSQVRYEMKKGIGMGNANGTAPAENTAVAENPPEDTGAGVDLGQPEQQPVTVTIDQVMETHQLTERLGGIAVVRRCLEVMEKFASTKS